MSEAEVFFVAEAIRHARKLPLRESILFLEGMAASLGTGHPLHSHITAGRELLNNGDDQLELIASGQLKFDLPQS